MPSLLLIDDDPAIIPKQLRIAFPPPSHTLEIARTGRHGLALVRVRLPDVVLLDLRLPDQSGLEVFREIRGIDARIPVVFITISTSADAAIEAMRQGAYDYLFKPLDVEQLQQVVGEAIEAGRRMREPTVLAGTFREGDLGEAIVGTCPAMREVYKAIGRVAGQNIPVLITGESGTGKELVAQAIYQHGSRSRAPFRALNCAAIPETLLESELFGHEKGAFTGADRRRIGKFEQCNRGTLFLDEIGDMPLALQAKILRLLQEQSFERVGGNETVRTDVRLIAATNHNLRKLTAEGKFRPDLFYRLSVFSIELPPLRHRGLDLLMLTELYLRRISRELGHELVEIEAEALEQLLSYTWPGNVRELQSVLKQAVLQTVGSILLPASLPPEIRAAKPPSKVASHVREGATLDTLEQDAIQHYLTQTKGNRQRTAKLLGISSRTLLRKIKKYRLEDPRRPVAPASIGKLP